MNNPLHPVIMGRDFLSKYALSINFLTSHLTLGNNTNFVEERRHNYSFNVIDFSHKNKRFQKFASTARQTLPNTSLDSEPDLDDFSETFLNDLKNINSDVQSVDSTSRILLSQVNPNQYGGGALWPPYSFPQYLWNDLS